MVRSLLLLLLCLATLTVSVDSKKCKDKKKGCVRKREKNYCNEESSCPKKSKGGRKCKKTRKWCKLTCGLCTPKVKCSANEEKFFVYSVDPSMLYPFVASLNASLAPPSATKGLVGNTWQGLQLSITQGDTTITQAGGKPLTVTSPNTLGGGGFNVVSEDFCLGDGKWKVRMGAFAWNPSTHPEFGAYDANAASDLTLEERLAVGAPINTVPVKPQAIVEWVKGALGVDVNNFDNNTDCTSDPSVPGNCFILSPFEIRWAIFPAEMRADAEAAAATGAFGMSFILDNQLKAWAIGEVDYENEKVVPSVPNGEQACEGHGYGKASCEAVGCCQYAECSNIEGSGECHSAVGRRQCTDVEFVSHDEDCS